MSYIDVMSDAAYGRYNRKLAKLAGLQAAVYWSEVLDVVGNAAKKDAFDEDGYFKIDRSYVEAMTGLSVKAQKEAEAVLSKADALDVHPSDPDRIGVHCDEMFKLLTGNDPKLEKKIPKSMRLTKEERADAKKAGIASRLKAGLMEEDPDLKKAYCRWIDSAVEKGLCKSVQVDLFKEAVCRYSSDKRTKIDVIETCAARSYKEAAWGIELYERTKAVRTMGSQKIASTGSVNQDLSF